MLKKSKKQFTGKSLPKNCTKACARDWSRAADDDDEVDPCLSHPRPPPPSRPDLCLSSALKSRTVAITLRIELIKMSW